MSWIFVDKEKGGEGEMRQQMRRNMRGSYRYNSDPMMRGNSNSGGYHEGYRQGYKEGWEDKEDDMNEEMYRRQRDSRGRFM